LPTNNLLIFGFLFLNFIFELLIYFLKIITKKETQNQMADLSKVLNETVGIDEEQYKEMITQNSLLQNVYKSDIMLASDFDDEDEEEDDDDDFKEEDEDLFDEDELEEEGYEEDFDFDEEEESDEEDLGTFN